jgi:hypothetical protein
MSLRLHERTNIVTKAKLDLQCAFEDWWAKHEDLTYLEVIGIVNEMQATNLKYALRHERHPAEDCDYKGDEECHHAECNAD